MPYTLDVLQPSTLLAGKVRRFPSPPRGAAAEAAQPPFELAHGRREALDGRGGGSIHAGVAGEAAARRRLAGRQDEPLRRPRGRARGQLASCEQEERGSARDGRRGSQHRARAPRSRRHQRRPLPRGAVHHGQV